MFDSIAGLIDAGGAAGVGLLMLLENLFPPIPSEVVMPLAGYLAATGRLGLVPVVLSGTLGALAGALVWYWIGRAFGIDRLRRLAATHGRWLTLSPGDIDRASAWFARHGDKAVFLGRLLPVVRTLISIPAGVAQMPLLAFTLWTGLGSLIWTSLLAGAGWLLGAAYREVGQWLDPVSTAIVGGIVAIYLYRVVTWRGDRPAGGGSP